MIFPHTYFLSMFLELLKVFVLLVELVLAVILLLYFSDDIIDCCFFSVYL